MEEALEQASGVAYLSDEELDFGRFVALRRRAREAARYAYGPDLISLARFRGLQPVELLVGAVVSAYKDLHKNELLGTTVRVAPDQLPRLHESVAHCARVLGIPLPDVYVCNRPIANAQTFGTDRDSYILIYAGLADQLDGDELRFVLGHEMGHIHNQHVVYMTVLRLLKQGLGVFTRWAVRPAELALSAWSRNAEITCDRAGLLCCGDLDVATRSLVKIACGSRQLYEQLNLESYLSQLRDGRSGIGRFGEFMTSHPYIPKRVQALHLFAQSEVYRRRAGLGDDGLSLEEVDRRVQEVMRIARGGMGEGNA